MKITIQENCDLYCLCLRPIVQWWAKKYESGSILAHGHCERHAALNEWKIEGDKISPEEVEVYRVMAS